MSTEKRPSIREVAHSYAARGWKVFPVYAPSATTLCTCSLRESCERPGKHPLTGNGLKDATTHAAQIAEWFPEGRARNIGINAGASGLAILDVDICKGGEESMRKLIDQFGNGFMNTLAATTGSGGLHFYFSLPPGRQAKSTTRFRDLDGIDVRGEGGFVVAPPSTHVSGGDYWFHNPDAELLPAPEWLLEGAAGPKREALITTIAEHGVEITEGGRNEGLFRRACALRAQGLLTLGTLIGHNIDACSPPLPDHEVESIYERAMKYGITRPVDDASGNPFEHGDMPTVPYKYTNSKGATVTELITPPDMLVSWWIERRGARYDYGSNLLVLDRGRTPDEVVTKILADGARVKRRDSAEELLRYVVEWLGNERQRIVIETAENLQGGDAAQAAELASTFIQALCGAEGAERRSADVAVLLHFIWQVKRKFLDMPVRDHMMPILFGRQGIGKSTAVRLLLEPLEIFTYHLHSLSVLDDPRESMLLGRYYVIFVDEMARSRNADIGILKKNITAPSINARVMRTTEHVQARNVATFLGCSNEPVDALVYDPTGVRRFWQINCADKPDWETINNIDYLALWRGVDPAGPSPLAGVADYIGRVQDTELRAKEPLEHFLDMECEETEDYLETSKSLYDRYTDFCDTNGVKRLTSWKFLQKLKAAGVESKHTKRGRLYKLKLRSPGTGAVLAEKDLGG